MFPLTVFNTGNFLDEIFAAVLSRPTDELRLATFAETTRVLEFLTGPDPFMMIGAVEIDMEVPAESLSVPLLVAVRSC